MKKIAVVYQSVHHSNTKKVLEHLREKFEFDLFDVKQTENVNFSAYDEVGLASGIYFGKLHSKVLEFFEKHFDELKKVFVIYTCGDGRKKHGKKYEKFFRKRGLDFSGAFHCKGYDTFGPFKIIGGIAKKHPDEKDLANACVFFENILKN